MVNWNGMDHLQECLSSLYKQTFKLFEIILVDNGSTDGSAEFVKENFPDTKIIKLKQNEGFCKGNNLGLQNASGDFIALLNNDARADKLWLQELFNAMAMDSQIGICASCLVNYFNPTIIDTAGDGYDISGVGFKIGNRLPVSDFKEKRDVFGACAGAALYRRSMVEKIGFFDEDFFILGEDIDLSFRARLANYRCLYVPEAIVYHKINNSVGVGSDFLVYHARRNVEYTYFKNMPTPLLLLTFPLHCLYEILTAFEAITAGKFKIFLKSKMDFLKNFPQVLKKRKYIQQNKNVKLSKLLALFSWNYLLRKTTEMAVLEKQINRG